MSAETHSQIASFIWGICKSDMLIKGEDADAVILGDTFTEDGFDRTPDGKRWTFDYMLANPPFGVEWKQQPRHLENQRATLGFSGRFGAGTPRVNDVDARPFWVQMEKSLGNKRRRIGDPSDKEKDPDHIGELTKIFGDFRDGQPEPDADPRDTETMPLKESIEADFKREVLPHVPDAWIDTTQTKVGYEIPLNRHFYRYAPPRPLEVIERDIRGLEQEIVRMLKEVTA